MPDYIIPPTNLFPGCTVWAYLRDSGGDGQEQSVPQQKEEISEYCKRHRLILAHVFSDTAKSGGSVEGREAFEDMLDMSSDPDLRPRGVLLWNFARFSRDLDDSSYYKALLRKRGIVVHSLTDPIPEGVYGRVVETFIDIANEEKRRQTARDVKRALAALVRQGYSPGGTPPRGYISVPVEIGKKRDGSARVVSRWDPDPELWDLAKIAWNMRAEGRSLQEITRETKGKLYKSSSCWYSFFGNKSYLGIGKCGDLEVPDHHAPMIDQSTWDMVGKLRRKPCTSAGNPRHPRRIAFPSLLSGLAVCGHCGYSMTRAKSKQKNGKYWHYYVCGRKINHAYDSCSGRQVNGIRADELVLDAVLNRVLTLDFLIDVLDQAKEMMQNTDDIDKQIESIREDLNQVNRAIDNLLDLAEVFGAKAAGDRLKEREIEREKVNQSLRELEGKRIAAKIEITCSALEAVIAFWRDEIITASKANDILSLKAIIRRFVSKVELEYNKTTIYYKFPIDSLKELRVEFIGTFGGT